MAESCAPRPESKRRLSPAANGGKFARSGAGFAGDALQA
jgi:hypothetical protein